MKLRVKVGEWLGNQDRPWANRRQSLRKRNSHPSHAILAVWLGFLLALAQGTLAYAQEASANKAPVAAPWAKLTPPQREALQPLGQVWDTLPSSRQLKWVALVANYFAMTPDDQVTLQSRMRDWAALGSNERDQARISFSETRKLTDEEKKAKWEAYKALSDAEKRALAKQSVTTGGVAAKPTTTLPQDKKVNMPAPTPVVRPSPLANATAGASQPVASGLGGSSEKHKPKLADVREKTSPNTLLPTAKQ